MIECASYETPLWTLVGVMVGFVLSYLYNLILQRKQYKARTREMKERIKKLIHLPDAKQAMRRLADSLPQFKEQEQIEILDEIGIEGSLNKYSHNVARYVIEEFRWLIMPYEFAVQDWPKHKPRKLKHRDKIIIQSIQYAIWNMAENIIEFRQSKKLLQDVLAAFSIIDNYSIIRKYEQIIATSIQLYKDIGLKSIGIMYGKSGFRVIDFKFGISQSVKQLKALTEALQKSNFKISKIHTFLEAIDKTTKKIETEYASNITR